MSKESSAMEGWGIGVAGRSGRQVGKPQFSAAGVAASSLILLPGAALPTIRPARGGGMGRSGLFTIDSRRQQINPFR